MTIHLYLPAPLAPRSEQGFTLIETLVAMVTGIIVVGALLAILDISLKQETRATDRVQVDQIGRTAMNSIMDELHSSCTGFGSAAIQAPQETPASPLASSGPANLWFLSSYGNSSSGNAVMTSVTEHDINWTSTGISNTGQRLGTLTDYAFPSTGGTPGHWTFPALTVANATAKHTAKTLAKNVIPPQIAGISTLFQYAKYNNNASSSTDGQLEALSATEIPLSASTAENVARVAISFAQAPEDKDTRLGRTASFSDSVVLRFNPAETGSEVENIPCE
jgi:Tfp pilus assembly protein PilV